MNVREQNLMSGNTKTGKKENTGKVRNIGERKE